MNGVLEPGAVFAGYRIERLLGTGGAVQVQITTLNAESGAVETPRELSVSTVLELVDGRWLCGVFNAPFIPG